MRVRTEGSSLTPGRRRDRAMPDLPSHGRKQQDAESHKAEANAQGEEDRVCCVHRYPPPTCMAPKTAGDNWMPSSAKWSAKRGLTPVGVGRPRNRPLASIPAL